MVVGAYTIINTIGLLLGLPSHLVASGTYIENISINNSFFDYYKSHTFQSTDYYLILDVKSTSYVLKTDDFSNLTYLNNPTSLTEKFASFTFNYSSSINGTNNNVYYIMKCSGVEYITDDGYVNNTMDIYSAQTNGYTFDINQVYFGVLSTKYTTLDSDNIINSITSGLGLMGDITTNFKNGFSALIWNSQENTLTTFGNFALIFLGVSITFAIVKLCLNLIRSKTGA